MQCRSGDVNKTHDTHNGFETAGEFRQPPPGNKAININVSAFNHIQNKHMHFMKTNDDRLNHNEHLNSENVWTGKSS